MTKLSSSNSVSSFEFSILNRLFTIENGELTPTLKVVRKVVLDHFSEAVEKIYSGDQHKIGESDPVTV